MRKKWKCIFWNVNRCGSFLILSSRENTICRVALTSCTNPKTPFHFNTEHAAGQTCALTPIFVYAQDVRRDNSVHSAGVASTAERSTIEELARQVESSSTLDNTGAHTSILDSPQVGNGAVPDGMKSSLSCTSTPEHVEKQVVSATPTHSSHSSTSWAADSMNHDTSPDAEPESACLLRARSHIYTHRHAARSRDAEGDGASSVEGERGTHDGGDDDSDEPNDSPRSTRSDTSALRLLSLQPRHRRREYSRRERASQKSADEPFTLPTPAHSYTSSCTPLSAVSTSSPQSAASSSLSQAAPSPSRLDSPERVGRGRSGGNGDDSDRAEADADEEQGSGGERGEGEEDEETAEDEAGEEQEAGESVEEAEGKEGGEGEGEEDGDKGNTALEDVRDAGSVVSDEPEQPLPAADSPAHSPAASAAVSTPDSDGLHSSAHAHMREMVEAGTHIRNVSLALLVHGGYCVRGCEPMLRFVRGSACSCRARVRQYAAIQRGLADVERALEV